MNSNVLASNQATLIGVIDPDAYAAGTEVTPWLSLADFGAIQAVVSVGDMQATSTVDAKLEQATDSSGTGAKDITGKSATQFVAGTDDNKQSIINCRSEELDVANGFDYVRLSVTTATAASDSGGFVIGHNARYQPEADAASVKEVV